MARQTTTRRIRRRLLSRARMPRVFKSSCRQTAVSSRSSRHLPAPSRATINSHTRRRASRGRNMCPSPTTRHNLTSLTFRTIIRPTYRRMTSRTTSISSPASPITTTIPTASTAFTTSLRRWHITPGRTTASGNETGNL